MSAVDEMELLIKCRDESFSRAIARKIPPVLNRIEIAISSLCDEEKECARAFLREIVDAQVAWSESPNELLRRWEYEKKRKIIHERNLTFKEQATILGITYQEAREKAYEKYKELISAGVAPELAKICAAGVLYEMQPTKGTE